jgi:hypothetical protein
MLSADFGNQATAVRVIHLRKHIRPKTKLEHARILINTATTAMNEETVGGECFSVHNSDDRVL